MSFNGWKLAGNGQMIRRFLFMKNMAPGELSAPAPRLYTCIFPQYSNLFYSETARLIKAKLHVEHPPEGETAVYINGPGHMAKMAATAINSKNLKIFFTRTRRHIILKL